MQKGAVTRVGIAPIDNEDGSIASCAPTGAPASNNRADVHGIAVRVADDDGDARRAPVVDQDLARRRQAQLHGTGGASAPDSQVHNH